MGTRPDRVGRFMTADDPLDRSLLDGFSFRCRPDCGLCCYASPAVTSSEAPALVRLEPGLELVPGEGGFSQIPARPEGGACRLLRRARCGAHAARPYPCRAYPVLVHIGRRARASLVLACPGVDLRPLGGSGAAPDGVRRQGPSGLDAEIRAAEAEIGRSPLAAWSAEHGRAEDRLFRILARSGYREDPEAVVARLATAPPVAEAGRGAGLSVPPRGAPLEELPLTFDERRGGVVALRGGDRDGTYEIVALREGGGIAERVGTYAVPEEPVRMEPDAERLLHGYARYLLDRDHLVWATYWELANGADGGFGERLRGNLIDALAEVLRRAAVGALAAGAPAPRLGPAEILLGIRATDAELLDRPTLGRVL